MARHLGRFLILSALLTFSILYTGCGKDSSGDGSNGNGLFGGGFNRPGGNGGYGNGSTDGSGNSGGASSGSGNSGGAGNGGPGPWGDFNPEDFFNAGNWPRVWPPPDDRGGSADPALPFRFRFTGPTRILTFSCVPYKLKTVNLVGQEVPTRQTIEAAVMDDGEGVNVGGFFQDANCTSAAVKVIFNPGDSSKNIYFKTAAARTSIFRATATLVNGIPPVRDGFYRVYIYNNQAVTKQLGINYEDWTDMDYNDAVACLANGALYTDGRFIKSYANQSVTFRVYGYSACDSYVRFVVRDPQGNVTQNVQYATHNNPLVTLNTVINSSIEVSFYSLGFCQTGAWVPQTDTAHIKLSNVCRGSDVEGKHI